MSDLESLEELACFFSGSTVLVTGSTGMLGQNAVATLLRLNSEHGASIKIVAQFRNRQKAEATLGAQCDNPCVELLECDIRDISCESTIDYIIHAAGVTGGSKQHIDAPLNTIEVALDGTRSVLELARSSQTKGLVFLSTLEIYGDTGFSMQTIRESDGAFLDPTTVRSSYPESKRMCECLCVAYMRQYGIPVYIARLTATFGPGVAFNDNRVFAQFARCVIENRDIVLKSSGSTVRNYCDAEDAARAFLVLLKNGESGEAYNIANMDTEISIRELAKTYIELFPESGIGLQFDMDANTAELGYEKAMRRVLDSRKLMDLGWAPAYSLEEMITRLVSSLKESADFK